MNHFKKKAALLILGSTITTFASATNIYRLEGFGAISKAMGGTANAYDVGPAGMMANPATLSLMGDGNQLLIGADVIVTDIYTKNLETGEKASSKSHSKNRGPYVIPEFAYTYRTGKYTFGVGVFGQGGIGTEYGKASFLSQATGGLDTGLETSSRLFVLNIPFALSYQVNEKLSVGAAIDATWQGLNLNLLLGADQLGSLIQDDRVGGSMLPALGSFPDLRGAHIGFTKNEYVSNGISAWGLTAKLGLTYKIQDNTILGMSYSTEGHMNDMTGDATLTVVDGLAGQVPVQGNIRVKDFKLPANIAIGISHKISQKWLVTSDFSRVFWEDAMKDIDITYASAMGDLSILLPQNYSDISIFSIGTSYNYQQWVFRAGFRTASKGLNEKTLAPTIPALPRKHITMGFSYKFNEDSTLDFAYSHGFDGKMKNDSLPMTSAPIEASNTLDDYVVSYTKVF